MLGVYPREDNERESNLNAGRRPGTGRRWMVKRIQAATVPLTNRLDYLLND